MPAHPEDVAEWNRQQRDTAPEYKLFKHRWVRASKDYTCGHCRQPIKKGDRHAVTSGTEDGKFFTLRTHSLSGACAIDAANQ